MAVDALWRPNRGNLAIGASFALLGGVGGAILIVRFPETPQLWALLIMGVGLLALLVALLSLSPRVMRHARGPEALAAALIAISGMTLLLGTLFTAWVLPARYPEISLFRPVYALWPGFYLVCLVLLRPVLALRASLVFYLVNLAVTLAGLGLSGAYVHDHEDLSGLLFLLLVANPLFLWLLSSVPRYASLAAHFQEEARLARALEDTRLRLDRVVSCLNVGVFERSQREQQIERWASPQFLKLLGYPSLEDEAARAPGMFDLMHPEDVRRVAAEFGARTPGADYRTETRLRCHDGAYRWFRVAVREDRDRDAEGKIIHRLTGSIEDIDERKRLAMERDEAVRQYQAMAYHDALTGLANRRHFEEAYADAFPRARRTGDVLSLLLIDIDHFKAYNDRFGHAAGDEVLARMGQVLRTAVRRTGEVASRYGGEEFVLLLPGTDADEAVIIADTLRAAIEALSIGHPDGEGGRLTVSIGANTHLPGDVVDRHLFFEEADQALYLAKLEGRNAVRHYRHGRRIGETEVGALP